MPKYDYRCTTCAHVYEKREGFDAPSIQSCPLCAGTARRVLTPPAIVFKGSGWYVTDSRKPAESGAAKPSAGESKVEGGGTAAEASDSKSNSSSGAATATASESKD